MNDCSNAEIRDQLPDLLHDRLTVSARAVVIAHVDGCADCRDELELLRGVRWALVARTPRVDIAYIVGALPKPPRAERPPPSRQRRWADWRVAAAVTCSWPAVARWRCLNPRAGRHRTTDVAARPVPITAHACHDDSVVRPRMPGRAAPSRGGRARDDCVRRRSGRDDGRRAPMAGDSAA